MGNSALQTMKKDITNQNICQVLKEDIPEEVILERLPVKSLFRFKSVSKQWKSMAESSYLAKKRLVRFQNPKLLILRSEISTDESSRTIMLETISKDHHDRNKIFICSYKLPDPHSEFHFDHVGRIMGHCNGLVCLYHFGCIYLINPTRTRIFRTLSPDFLRNCTGRPSWSGELPITVGFGRDIATGTYKVILMYYFKRISWNFVKTEVLNLNSGERRCICCPIRYDQLITGKTSIFANGSLFWFTFRKLAALDLHTEKFRYVLLPSWYIKYSESMNLWSLKDRLCLSYALQYPNVDIWSLQQEDPSVKWEKIFSINILRMDCLDSDFWKLGLAAFSYRPIGEKPSESLLEKIPVEHFRTVLYTENLISSAQFRDES